LNDIALLAPTSELQEITCYMGSHSVTCHLTVERVPRLTQARKAGTRSTYRGGMEGWVDLCGWLHTEMVYPCTRRRHHYKNAKKRKLEHCSIQSYLGPCTVEYFCSSYCKFKIAVRQQKFILCSYYKMNKGVASYHIMFRFTSAIRQSFFYISCEIC